MDSENETVDDVDDSYLNCTYLEVLYSNLTLPLCIEDEHSSRIFIENPDDMLDPSTNPVFYPILITHIITFLVGIVGNTVVIATWTGRGKLRSPTAAFLVSLAAADLLLLLLYVPLETFSYFVVTWDTSGVICKLYSYVEMLSGMASVLNLVAVSFERFLVIVHPIRARSWCTTRTSIRGLLVVWTLAILLAAPVLVTKSVYSITYYNNLTSITAYYCWDTGNILALAVSIYQLMSMFVFPALFMVVCYFCVIQELWASTKVVASMTRPTSSSTRPKTTSSSSSSSAFALWKFHCHHRQSYVSRLHANKCEHNSSQQTKVDTALTLPVMQSTSTTTTTTTNTIKLSTNVKLCRSYIGVRHARKQVIKMLLLVITLFLLCWGPRLIMNVLIKIGLKSFTQIAYTTRVACYLLSFIHSAINPFVYGLMSTNFRRIMLNSCTSTSSAQASSEAIDHHLIACYERNRNRKFSDIYEPSATTAKTCCATSANHDIIVATSAAVIVENSASKCR